MRAFLLFALSALVSLCAAQDENPPTAPTLVSVVESSDARYALLTWTRSYSCASSDFCWYSVFRDADTFIDVIMDNAGTETYNYAAYFGTSSADLQYGVHSFYVQESNLFGGAGPNSTSITVNLQPLATPTVPTPTPQIVGDPQFTGLRGQVYQVHGAPNEIFNIISDSDLQYNSKFVYLDSGDCPSSQGEPVETPCFTHPGTYLGELGLETSAGDRIFIKAGAAARGFAAVELNGIAVALGESVNLQPLERGSIPFIQLNSSHVLTIEAGNFRFEFSNSDLFVNQIVSMIDETSRSSHGLLGQSWSTRVHNAAATIPWIEGSVWDYAIEDHKLFSHKFAFNKFSHSNTEGDELVESKIRAELDSKLQQAQSDRQSAAIERVKAMGKRKVAHANHAHKRQADI